MPKSNVRSLAHDILIRVEKSGSFSHLLLANVIKKENLAINDERLLTEIVYGTIERQITLDYYVSSFIQSKKRIEDWVKVLLRMSIYQLYFLEKVPEYAIINEAVNIAKRKGHKGIGSFVNGVLRSILRKGVPNVNDIKDPIDKLSIQTSHPKWLVERWVDYYGYDVTEQMCQKNLTRKPIAIRVNSLKTTRDEIKKQLGNKGMIGSNPFKILKHGIIIEAGNIFKTKLIQDGFVTIQDQSSMLAAQSLQVEPNMKVLDACSAPGGKATYLGELMQNKGSIFAYDLHKNKMNLIKHNAERLGITNIHVGQHDARKLQEVHEKNYFDRILVDAPCSGLGVIRTKPDIKYNKRVNDIENLQQVQLDILFHVAPLLKKGGKLIYCTCTVERMENEEVVKKFLDRQDTLQVDKQFLTEAKSLQLENVVISKYGLQLFPQSMDSDGFFITRFTNFTEDEEVN